MGRGAVDRDVIVGHAGAVYIDISQALVPDDLSEDVHEFSLLGFRNLVPVAAQCFTAHTAEVEHVVDSSSQGTFLIVAECIGVSEDLFDVGFTLLEHGTDGCRFICLTCQRRTGSDEQEGHQENRGVESCGQHGFG